jgi:hypothetical protein
MYFNKAKKKPGESPVVDSIGQFCNGYILLVLRIYSLELSHITIFNSIGRSEI